MTKTTIPQEKIKGAKTIVLIGFLSIFCCALYAVPGTIVAIIGILKYKKVKEVALSSPAKYQNSFVDAKAGLILCYLGFFLSIATLIWTIGLFYPTWFFGGKLI